MFEYVHGLSSSQVNLLERAAFEPRRKKLAQQSRFNVFLHGVQEGSAAVRIPRYLSLADSRP